MGIRFKCPNGHKINVKSFLAGKKARCPDCGERVVVPFESETADSLGASIDLNRGAEIGAEATLLAEEAPPTTAAPVAAHAVAPAAAQTKAAPVAAVAAPIAPVALAPPAPARPDPIAEAPLAVWYVRPRAGGQFGPAPGDVFRQWITEKRVAADSLVWRDGWPEWRLASETLPQFASRPPAPSAATAFMTPAAVAPAFAGNGTSPMMAQAPMTPQNSAVESPAMAASAKYLRSRKSRTSTIVAICSLAIVAIALIAVLIYVLNKPQ